MLLALDSSTAACTAALFAADGKLLASADEVIGRGHAERLVPIVEELLDGRVPGRILVGCGPGSFTGLRVGIAAAHGLAIGWGAELSGMNSLALLAAGAPGEGAVAVAVTGGHGELFVQQFARPGLKPLGPARNLSPAAAAAEVTGQIVVGSGAQALVAARGWGEAHDLVPSARNMPGLPPELATLPPRPVYGRAPDAKPKAA